MRRLLPRLANGLVKGPAAGLGPVVGLLLAASAAAAAPETPPVVTVFVDNAKVMRLPERTQTIIVGNPIIADVTLQKNGVIVLTGKSFGSTNLIALDGAGAMIAETTIRVDAAQTSVVTVQRGALVTVACVPTVASTPVASPCSTCCGG